MTAGILEGIKVVEFAQNAAIPQCGRILAGMGADVVKVEPPQGDAMRGYIYAGINPGKRSMAVNLASDDAPEVIDALFRWADVALVAFKQSDLARYGIDWDHARTVNPRLVHLTHTPFGPDGPDADQGGYDVLVQALSGMGFTINRSENGVPMPSRPAINDFGTGIAGALGVVAALRHRDQTGEGQRVDVSLLATALNLSNTTVTRLVPDSASGLTEAEQRIAQMRDDGVDFDETRSTYENQTPALRNFRLYFRHYNTADGLMTVAGLSRGLIAKFHAATGITEPARKIPLDSVEFQAAVAEAEETFATKTTAQWLEILRGVGFPCGRYNLPFEALNDPQVRANDWFVADLEHPTLGPYTTNGSPVQFSAAPISMTKSAPLFAAHTVEMLSEIGLDGARIKELVESETVISSQ